MTALLPSSGSVRACVRRETAGKLRILHVVLSLDVGGLERNVLNQIRIAPDLGQEMSVLCLERPGDLAPAARALGAEVICLDKPPGLRMGVIWQLRQALRRRRPHVVHTHQVATLFYAGWAAHGLRGACVVHTAHGREAYDRRRTRLLGRAGGAAVDRFFCLTQDLADEVVRLRIVPSRRVRLITNGIDTARYRDRGGRKEVRRRLAIPDTATVVGSVGRLVEVKNQSLLIRAFVRLRRRRQDLRLLLVGDGPLRAHLEELTVRLGVREAISFAGYQKEVADFLAAMDVFALTSDSEGTPQAVLEASMSGLPVVATGVGGLPDVIEHGKSGLLFPPGDEEALCDALWAVLSDSPRALAMAAGARGRVQAMFDVRRMASEYHAHYQELLGVRGEASSRSDSARAGL